MSLKGKVAIVTGGGQGIGRCIALRLAKEAAKIAIFDLNRQLARAVVEEIVTDEAEAVFFRVDVSSMEEVKQAVNQTIDKFRHIDILVNNAGINKDKLLLRMEDEDWGRVLQTNLTGTFNCMKVVLRSMVKNRYGRIVNVSSVVGIRGNVGQANYAASKAGIIGLTKSVAREVARYGVTVNAVAPGFIDTPMTRKLGEEKRQEFISQIPMGREGTPEEVADAVSYLVREEAAYITGEIVRIDGGLAM
ncbi:3-oxoacyl-[acyl-carrier-protein] reductase [Candidatus Aerophobetes bacterium]|uniref:3-oxoacyl-[acyl-carrier-protein] reductase n=1 Tax=Aerophobetes bacterium TaxID=2030807 RepID=A0A523WA30_UNCAE|nr:MAG: 3-oxoacyl-[acyl-carrier-protein] reductase [Candidatus Aerophobetes bacterium]